MSNKDNGGPAFPAKTPTEYVDPDGFYHWEGMSLRDYFAGQALPAFIEFATRPEMKQSRDEPVKQAVANSAYEYADAMLKARES